MCSQRRDCEGAVQPREMRAVVVRKAYVSARESSPVGEGAGPNERMWRTISGGRVGA